MINLSFRSGIFPDELKFASVIPLHKKGDVNETANYRPISILPAISKIFEKLIKNKITCYFEKNSLFCPNQFGFRQGRSTTAAVIDFVDFALTCFERGEYCAATFCDISKAFDCVDHNILLQKLKLYNFDQLSLQYFQSYLSNRRQVVKINHNISNEVTMHMGVPQGSILGPILFLIYINDFPKHVTMGKCILFADDTTVQVKSMDGLEALETASLVRDCAEDWCTSNRLVLNTNKTVSMIFSLRNNAFFDDATQVKYLGFTLDSRLKWGPHCDGVAVKLLRTIYLLRNLVLSVSLSTSKTAYFALFHSVMSYGIILWGHSSSRHRIFGLQRRAVRTLYKLPFRADCRVAFTELGILTFPVLDCLLYLKDNMHAFDRNTPSHTYNTRSGSKLSVQYTRLTSIQNTYNVKGVKFYNALPDKFKSLSSKLFKATLKKLLISHAIYNENEYFNCVSTLHSSNLV